MIEEIKAAVQAAAGTNQKIAMFHFQVLKNAHELEGVDPKAFCREIGVRESYATEFTKMISLARVINEQGMRLVWHACARALPRKSRQREWQDPRRPRDFTREVAGNRGESRDSTSGAR